MLKSRNYYITSLQTLIFSIVLIKLVASSRITVIPDANNPDFESDARKTPATSAPSFIQLVIMRLIYGIASTIGVEDRLEDTFNGAFIPPNADDGLLGFGGGGGDSEGDGFLGGIFEGDDYL
ncbi:hypothetical protein KR215_003257 [Drosophila sulfurigaster]|nr:hypothetical protein KR215_003257 [Drosophila sulfurigaster]